MRRNSSVTTPPLSEHVRAHFQPIFSVDSDRVYAYEALGRRLLPDGTVCSLGPFFSDPAISDEQALRVDRIVRQAALRKYAEDGPDAYLFLNIRLTWLCAFNDHPQDMLTIRWAEECGIRPDRLVIEITEDECRSDMRSYMRAIEFYKRQGCRVAIDDYGKNASDIDRLSVILPDIIKINIEYIHKSVTSYHYKAYLQALASFAENVGIEALYEGVETQEQLDICLASGGRYYQGFLLAKPQSSFCRDGRGNAALWQASQRSLTACRRRISLAQNMRDILEEAFKTFWAEDPRRGAIGSVPDALLADCLRFLPESVLRIYVCDKSGIQLSGNVERLGLDIVTFKERKGQNLAWRGYFQKTLEAFEAGHTDYLSPAYRDLNTKSRIFTYARLVDDGGILLMDILRVPEESAGAAGL